MNHQIPYVLIPVSALELEQPSLFDLYVKVGSKYVKVLKKDEMPDLARIQRYLDKKDDALYIESSNIEYFMDEKFSGMFECASSSPSVDSRIRAFLRCAELCYLDLKIVRLHPDKFMRFSMLAELGHEFFSNRFIQRQFLRTSFSSINSPLSRRAVLGGSLALSMLLSKGECTPRIFKSLFIGAVLRDLSVGLVDDKDPHLLRASLSDEDRTSFEEHPRRSIELLRSHNLLDDLIENIIIQHHEEPRGTGFPLGLKRVETYKPAQYLQISDWFISLMEEAFNSKGEIDAKSLIINLNKAIPDEQRQNLPLLNHILVSSFNIAVEELRAAA